MHPKVNDMENDEMSAILNQIGNILAEDTEYPLDGTLLYVEAEFMMLDVSIFKDLGDHLLFRWSSDDLTDPLLELWDIAPEDKRWSAMEYRIQDGRFEVAFTYPEEFDEEMDTIARRDRVLKRRFGNKRIVYPNFPGEPGTFAVG
jgi:hypothetical protein